jgi:hypothetical protein
MDSYSTIKNKNYVICREMEIILVSEIIQTQMNIACFLSYTLSRLKMMSVKEVLFRENQQEGMRLVSIIEVLYMHL